MWKDIVTNVVAWVKAKGGWAHLIAGIWAFLVAAYEMDAQFHAYVIHVQQSLPGSVESLVTIALSLWAFYKTWGKSTQAQLEQDQKEKEQKEKP